LKIKSALTGALLILLLFTGCSDDPSLLGVDFVKKDELKVIVLDALTDSMSQNSRSYREIIALGNADRLLLGNRQGIRSSILLEFSLGFDEATKALLADSKDSIEIISNKVILTPNYKFGDTTGTFPVSSIKVNEIKTLWDPLTVRVDSLPDIDMTTSVLDGTPSADSNYHFSLNNALVMKWMKNTVDTNTYKNNGVFISVDVPTPYIAGFKGFSTDITVAPRIDIRFRKKGASTDTTITFRSISDAHVVEASFTQTDPTLMTVQSGLTVGSSLYFDLKKLPKDIVINRATLQINGASSEIGSSGFTSLLARTITELNTDSTAKTYGVPSSTLSLSNNVYSGEVTSALENMFYLDKNLGFYLSTAAPAEGLEKIVLKGSSYPVYNERPRLVITYTLVK